MSATVRMAGFAVGSTRPMSVGPTIGRVVRTETQRIPCARTAIGRVERSETRHLPGGVA
jgi:hypothetical protein